MTIKSASSSMFKSLASLDCSLETLDEHASRSLDPMIEDTNVLTVSSPSLMLSPNLIASLLHVSKDVIFNPIKNRGKSCSSLSLS